MDNPIPPPDIVIHGLDKRFSRTVETAARLAFPGCRIVTVDSLTEVASQQVPRPERMILLSSAEEAEAARRRLPDASGLQPLIAALPWVLTLPENVCHEVIARMLRSEWEVHWLRSENERMTGDLAMIGRRIGHDIRMHLGGIVSTADLLADLIPEPEDPQWRLTKSVHHSVEEILVLLDRVKAIVMTAGPAPRDQETMIGDVAMAEAQRLETRMHEQTATLNQPDRWPPVHGVHSWLKVIWSILFTNALQHGGERVQIETGWSRNGDWRFFVRDNGPGVDPERRENLFPSIQSLYELHGHGTGLAILRRLCERMGGSCGYESPPEGGACFWFTLPATASAESGKL